MDSIVVSFHDAWMLEQHERVILALK